MRLILTILCLLIVYSATGQMPEFNLLRPFSTNELPTEIIYGITKGNNGLYYIGTEKGLFAYNGIHYRKLEINTKGKAFHNLISHKGKVYAFTFSKELVIIDSIENTKIFSEPKFNFQKASENYILKDTLYSFKKNIIKRPLSDLSETILINSQKKSEFYQNIFEAFQSGMKNIKLKRRLMLYDSIPFPNHKFKIKELYSNEVLFHYENSHNNEHFYGLNSGLYYSYRLNPFSKRALTNIPVSEIYRDENELIWVATLTKGLFLICNSNHNNYDYTSYLENNDIFHSKVYKDSVLYLGTRQGYLLKHDLNNQTIKKIKLSPRKEIESINFDKNHIYAYANYIYIIDSKKFNVIDSINLTSTKSILVKNDVVYASSSEGFFLAKKKQNISQFFRKIWINSSFFSFDSTHIFLNSENGVGTFNLSDSSINFDTTKRNYKIFHSSDIESYLTKDELKIKQKGKTNTIKIEDVFDDYLIQDSLLIMRNESQITIKNWKNNKTINTLNKFDGILKSDIKQWEIINERLILIYKDFVQDISYLPPKVSNKNKIKFINLPSEPIYLNYQEELDLNLDVLNIIKDLGGTEIFFKISKISEKWRKLEIKNGYYNITKERLPSGTYDLLIQTSDAHGRRSNTTKISLIVAYPFWQKWWFIITMVAIFIGIVYIFLKIRTNKLRKENSRILREKQLEINTLNSRLEALRSQMNPHFIFNTINTIQSQIITKDKNAAYSSLNTFSKLMRSALEHSQDNFIPVKEDFEFIKNYVELESLRLKNNIKIDMFLAENLKNLNPKIPSLVTQPIIENAFKHGLKHKQNGDKKLVITYKLLEKEILILISDNGVGRKKSKEINEMNKIQTSSFSTNSIKERIAILNKSEKRQISLTTRDLNTGTEVLIKVKI